MRRTHLATLLALLALPAYAGPTFKTAIVGSEPALICPTRTLIQTYQLNRLNDPVRADKARAGCKQMAPGSRVELVYQYGDEILGAYIVQIKPNANARIGYALTSAFSIAQVAQVSGN